MPVVELQEAECPACHGKFKYPKCGYRPMTCEKVDCVRRYHHPYLRRG